MINNFIIRDITKKMAYDYKKFVYLKIIRKKISFTFDFILVTNFQCKHTVKQRKYN